MIKREDISDMIQSAKLAGFNDDETSNIKLDDELRKEWNKGKKLYKAHPKLPDNHSAIYIFYYNNDCLKVGKAGLKSNARYQSQHYNYSSSTKSSLPKKLTSKEGKEIFKLDFDENSNENKEELNHWIKKTLFVKTYF